MDETNNVTFRRPQLPKAISLEGINNSLNSSVHSIDVMGRSFDLSTRCGANDMEEMKTEITILRSKLESTQNELDNIILENNDLKKHLSQLSQEVDFLKQICRSPASSLRKSICSTRKDKRRRLADSFRSSPNENMTDDTAGDMSNDILKTVNKAEEPEKKNKSPSEQPHKVPEINIEQQHMSAKGVPAGKKNIKCNSRSLRQSQVQNNPKRLFLFGGKQCSGLPEKLRKSRARSLYDHYQIVSFIKPNASTAEILNCAKLFDISKDDRVLICVGQHDANPLLVMADLSIYLKHAACPIFIFQVFSNKHLMEIKLNDMLIMISRHFKNCTFIEFCSEKPYEMCVKINSIVDQFDYNEKFLTFTKKKLHTGQNYKVQSTKHQTRKNKPTITNKHTQTELVPLFQDASTQTDDIPIHQTTGVNTPENTSAETTSAEHFFRA